MQPDTEQSNGLFSSGFIQDGILKIRNKRFESGKPKQSERIELSVNRLKKKPTYLDMSSMTESNDWYRRNRSRVYFYILPIVCAFYFVPAIQYSFQAKKNEDIFGNQDLCYHNFRYYDRQTNEALTIQNYIWTSTCSASLYQGIFAKRG